MRFLSHLKFAAFFLLASGFMLAATGNLFAQTQRYVQIDVKIVEGKPTGEDTITLNGKKFKAWDSAKYLVPAAVPPDPKICVESGGERQCVTGNCPNLYFCTFIGVPIMSDSFKLEVWDEDAFEDDLVGKGSVSANGSFKLGQAEVKVTEIPCSDKEIQVNYYKDENQGRYLFDSGFKPYPVIFGSPRFHHFTRLEPICVVGLRGCDVKTIFEIMIGQVRFVAPSKFPRGNDPVVNCKVNYLIGLDNPVRTVIDSANSKIVNYTLEEHIFYPGKITRQIVQDGGVIFVTTEGEGFGQYAWLNEQVGGKVIFQVIDNELKNAVTEKLELLNKSDNQNKPVTNATTNIKPKIITKPKSRKRP